jgi:hypothetical protein
MSWTSLTGESTWTCENCGKRNTIGTGPSPGPSNRQTCSGCDHYQEVSQDRTALIIITLVVLLGAVGTTILIGGWVVAVFWLLVLSLAGASRMFFPAGAPP